MRSSNVMTPNSSERHVGTEASDATSTGGALDRQIVKAIKDGHFGDLGVKDLQKEVATHMMQQINLIDH